MKLIIQPDDGTAPIVTVFRAVNSAVDASLKG